jgi:predicted ATPase
VSIATRTATVLQALAGADDTTADLRRCDDRAAVTVQAGERTPFIGREQELAHLRRLLDGALVGRGELVLIAGEPGIGKTRLAQEQAAEAASKGMRPLTGHCVDRQGSPPYLPFVEIVETLQRHLPLSSFREVLGDAAGEMARLLPGLRRSWPELPSPLELPPEQERRYLFNCFAEVLHRASNLAPPMLVLEDLQWADEATLLLLEHVSRRVAETPLLILGTYRDTELDPGSGLAGTLEGLIRSLLSQRLVLRPLGIAETADMLFALSGQTPQPRP